LKNEFRLGNVAREKRRRDEQCMLPLFSYDTSRHAISIDRSLRRVPTTRHTRRHRHRRHHLAGHLVELVGGYLVASSCSCFCLVDDDEFNGTRTRQGTKDRYQRACTQQQHAIACRVFTLLLSHLLLLLLLPLLLQAACYTPTLL